MNGVKVFSSTMYRDRGLLGERVTEWIGAHPNIMPLEFVVTQSSDSDYHCVTITVFYSEASPELALSASANTQENLRCP